jgi:hypothetical protein
MPSPFEWTGQGDSHTESITIAFSILGGEELPKGTQRHNTLSMIPVHFKPIKLHGFMLLDFTFDPRDRDLFFDACDVLDSRQQ